MAEAKLGFKLHYALPGLNWPGLGQGKDVTVHLAAIYDYHCYYILT